MTMSGEAVVVEMLLLALSMIDRLPSGALLTSDGGIWTKPRTTTTHRIEDRIRKPTRMTMEGGSKGNEGTAGSKTGF